MEVNGKTYRNNLKILSRYLRSNNHFTVCMSQHSAFLSLDHRFLHPCLRVCCRGWNESSRNVGPTIRVIDLLRVWHAADFEA